MATAGQLTTVLVLDSQQFQSGMLEVQGSIEQTTTVIQVQDQTWRSFAASYIGTVGRLAGPAMSLAAQIIKISSATSTMAATNAAATIPTFTLGAAVNFLLSPIVLTVAAIALLAGAVYLFAGGADDASNSIKQTTGAVKEAGDAAKEAKDSMSSLSQIQDSFMAGFVGTEGLDALDALGQAGEELKGAFGELGMALLEPLKEMGFEFGSLANLVTGFTAKINSATEAVKRLTSIVGDIKKWAQSGIETLSVSALQFTRGMSADEAKEFLASQKEIRNAKIEAYQNQKAEQFAAKEMEKILGSATEEEKKRAEISRIGSITSAEAIGKETVALQAHIAELKKSGRYSGDAKKDAEELAQAIAKQGFGIENGTIKDKGAEEAEKRAEKARESLAKLQNELAVLNGTTTKNDLKVSEFAMTANSLSDVEKYKSLLEQIDAIQAKNKADSQIASLRDEIDLLSGASTAAQQALRDMTKDVIDPKTKEEIAKLIEQRDQLKKSTERQKEADQLTAAVATPAEKLEKELERIQSLFDEGRISQETADRAAEKAQKEFGGGSDKSPFSGAVLAGSQDAVRSILNVVGKSTNPNAKLEGITQQQLEKLGNIADGIDDINTGQPQIVEFA